MALPRHNARRAGKFLLYGIAMVTLLLLAVAGLQAQVPTPIPGNEIPKYVDPLPHFAGNRVTGTNLTVSTFEFQEKVLPANFYCFLPKKFRNGTYVWGYQIVSNKQTFGPLYPGFTIDATRNKPITVTYLNQLPINSFLQYTVLTDQTLHWANPLNLNMTDPLRLLPYEGPPPVVTHLHGGEVPSDYDGGPDSWFTPNGLKGLGYRSERRGIRNGAQYEYPDAQEPTTLWYHDHALGATRLNVFRGLAGFYLLRDWYNRKDNPDGLERPDLPGGPCDTTVTEPGREVFADKVYKPEIELAIQDRMFDTNGQLYFPSQGINPEHPFWVPEFFGDVMVVNGKSWPFLNVEPRRYRFRVLDGCNARFLQMWLQNSKNGDLGPVVWQIGSDGGLLDRPAELDPSSGSYLFLAPGERADIIIDFSGFAGKTLTLMNGANAPFPDGTDVDPDTTGQIMQFRVGRKLTGGPDKSYNPATGQSPRTQPIDNINARKACVKRQLTLNEWALPPSTVDGTDYPGGPVEILVNNTKWSGERPDPSKGGMLVPIPGFVPDGRGDFLSELPKVGSTEIWEIVNLTMDAHPIHLHLVQFQLIERQDFDAAAYFDGAYSAAFPGGSWIPEYGPPNKYSRKNMDGAIGGNPGVFPYLTPGTITPPLPEELGWKDTIKAFPGQVTRIKVRFTEQDGSPFPFDATGLTRIAYDQNGRPAKGPGYVWHCHIVDHEDNEMMRPYNLVP